MKKIYLALCLIGVLLSCTDDFEEMNQPQKNPVEIPGDNLFTNGLRNMYDNMVNTNVNRNVFRLYAQYWSQTTYPEESQYNMVNRNIPDNVFRDYYRDVLSDFNEAKKLITAELESEGVDEVEINNKLAIIQVCEIFTYCMLVETFGDIPFSEALDTDNLTPKYDDGSSVYNVLLSDLDAAIGMIDTGTGAFSADQDPVYRGDVGAWLTFANSMKFKMGMMMSDLDPTLAKGVVETALAAGIISSNAENAAIEYTAVQPNTNPLWVDLVQSGRKDFVISNTVVDILNSLQDTRIEIYGTDPLPFTFPRDGDGNIIEEDVEITTGEGMFLYHYDADDELIDREYRTTPFTLAIADTATIEGSQGTLAFFKGGEYGTANSYSKSSHIGTVIFEPDLPGVIMSYAEMQFLLAEATERGFATGKTAEEFYNEGVKASFEEWGLPESDFDDYIAQPSVAYATAAGDWKQKIGMQSWLAAYNRGYEGWTTWRRLDFTAFNAPDGMELTDIPTILIYPINEGTLNGTNKTAAASAIGGDEATTKLFWDKF